MKAIWYTVLKLALFLYAAEAGIMFLLELMHNSGLVSRLVPDWLVPELDAAMLVLLASPAIYFWVLRPQIAAERTKSRMLLVMSHELRNPLNGIVGMIDAIRGEVRDERTQGHLAVARGAALRLTEKIDVLLYFAEGLEPHHKLKITAAEPSSILNEEVAWSRAACDTKGLHFKLQGADLAQRRINTDLKALRRILHVLLDNAVRYTRDGGVTLEVGVRKALGSERMDFIVRDTGPGLGDAPRTEMFRPFESGAVSHGRLDDGLRLGLPVAKWLAEELGGTLDVLNARDGTGTVATLSLPI